MAIAMFLNGARIVKLQLAVALATGIVAIALKFLLVPSIGVAGVVWATVLAYLVFAAFRTLSLSRACNFSTR